MKNIVTGMTYPAKNKNRVHIFIDNEFAFSVPLLQASTLETGKILSQSEIDELKKEHDAHTAYSTAIRYLARTPRSRREIEHHLRRKRIPLTVVDDTLQKLKENGQINDESYARIFVENRERFGPRSKAALRFELKGKGIEEEVIDHVTGSADDLELALKAIRGKIRQFRELKEKETFREKALAFLARRGFSYEVADEAIENARNFLEEDQNP